MTAVYTDRDAGTPTEERGAALWNAEGYSVRAHDGHVGVVEDTVRIPGLRRPAALAVRLAGHGERVVLVPVSEILEVDADTHTIRVREVERS